MASKIPSQIVRAATVAVLFLATVVVVLRLLVPRVDGLAPRLEGVLSELMGHPVTVGDLEARWRILSARIRVTDLAIREPGISAPLFHSETVEMTLDLPASLWSRRPVLDQVRVRGADLHVLRDEQGRIRVLGGAPPGEVGDADLLALLAGNRFLLEDSRLRWEDRLLGIDDRFEDLNLWVALEAGRLRLKGNVFLPERLGQDIEVALDLRHEKGADWDGRGYLHSRELHLEGFPQATRNRLGMEAGDLNARLWVRWDRGHLSRVQTRLEATGLVPEAGDADGPDAPLDLSGHLLWTRAPEGWTLRGEELSLRREGVGWPPASGFDLSWRRGSQGERLRARFDHLRLEDVAPFLAGQSLVEGAWRARLARLRPAGVLSDLQLDLRRGGDAALSGRAEGRFRGLRMAPDGNFPGVSGLDGGMDWTSDGGQFWLDGTDVRLEIPEHFERPLRLQTLEGTVDWIPGPGGGLLVSDDLSARNADLAIRARGRLHLGENPALDLAADLREGDARAVAGYLPRGVPADLRRWLERALQAGRLTTGGMVLRGALRDFPFRDGEGVFRLGARVEGGQLSYRPGWPVIEDLSAQLDFDGAGMTLEATGGGIAGVGIQQARAEIPNLEAPHLQVRGRARGGLGDYLGFVRASPLAAGAGDWLDPVRAESGEGALELALEVPLEGDGRTRISGGLSVREGRFVHGGRGWTLDTVDGTLSFTRETLMARGITARLEGVPLTLDARRSPVEGLTVEARGARPVDALLAPAPAALRQRLGGTIAWHARLRAPVEGEGLRLELDSDLRGLESRLPAPLDKPAGVARPLGIRVDLSGEDVDQVRLSLDEVGEAVFTPGFLEGTGRGAVRLGGGTPDLPEGDALALDGRMARLDGAAWNTLFSELEREGNGGGSAPPVALDLRVGRLEWAGLRLDDAAFKGHRDGGGWSLVVDAPSATGWIRRPPRDAPMDPLVVDLERLDLDALIPGPPGGPSGWPDPRGLPPLRLQSDRLTWRERTLEDVVVSTQPQSDGLEILRAEARTPDRALTLSLRGQWRDRGDGAHHTTVEGALEAGDLGRGLGALDFRHPFQEGRGEVRASLSWPGAPFAPDPAGLRGRGSLRMEEGRLAEVEPGAGRLLGLFSLELLPRRLNLDFRDLVQRGFAYDRMEGEFTVKEGALYTPDLHIRGPSARIHIQGTTDLVRRSYDQRIIVTPSVGGTLPLAGVLLGGPVAGLAVFVFDRVTGVGTAIDEAARVEYRVTGPWGDPRVAAVARTGSGEDAPDGGRQ
ncbi:MAG: YhdP family protein [Ectothiorhodospira sp.]